MELVGKHITVLIWLVSLARISYQAEDVLYPFGQAEGDSKLANNDDGDSGKIKLLLEFPYFDENHDSLIVNTNGIISFIKNVSQYTPDVFPLDDDRRIIAPYWADVDTSTLRGQNGKVWYRQTTNDPTLLQNLTEQIGNIFRVEFRFRPFVAKFAFVATWENVTFYSISNSATPKRNTFQAVLVSDGDYSFTIFNYETLTWTTGSSSFGNKGTGLAGNSSDAVAAQVGFNAGDGSNYYSVPGSRTDAILDISHTSNILVPGRWVFRIDGKSIEAGGCGEDTTQLQISPQQVSMLGGDVLSISGPCFERRNNILCRIEDVVIDAIYDPEKDPFTVRCPSPMFMRVGPADVELSRDGGRSYNYTGRVSVVGLDQIEPSIAVEEMSADVVSLTWNTEGFPSPDSMVQDIYIDILLYFYEESTTTGLVRLAPASRIRSDIRLANDQVFLTLKEISEATRGRSVGVFRITEAGEVNTNISNKWVNGYTNIMEMETPIAAMWSLPFNLNSDSSSNASRWCERWASDQISFRTTEDSIPPCPCLLSQALADISVFERYPWCNQRLDDGCEYRQEAKHCVRARISSNLGHGQLCCYGSDNNLMHLKDTPAGGYTQKHHHSGFLPAKFPGNIPYLSNYLRDRIPWEECCGKTQAGTEQEKESCDLFRGHRPSEQGLRPSDDCKFYRTPTAAAVFGEPHLITFDAKDYIFNGFGEYVLLTTKDTTPSALRIEVQGRMQQIDETVLATGLTAVAIKSDTSSTVQVELNERREMDAWIQTVGSDDGWNHINFVRSNFWMDSGVTIELGSTEDDRKLFSVTFNQGIAVVLEKPPNSTAMSIRVYLPPTLKEQVLGLLGTWNNDSSDDFTAPSGRIISGRSQENLHIFFGQEWNVNLDETLFRYDVGLNYSLINDEDFEPNHEFPNFVTEDELIDVCDDNRFCRYDYIKTGNPDMGEAAGHAHNMWERTRNQTTNVVSCGYLPPPEHGSKMGVVYLAGSVVTMTCNEGFDLKGTIEWRCSSEGRWIGNQTSTCVESKNTNMLLILYIVMAIVAFLILISCCLICFVCIMRRRKDKEHDRERSKSNAGLTVAYQNGGYAHDGGITKINGVTPTSNGISNGNGSLHHIAGMTETDGGVANGQSANGHATNGHSANGGHTASGHTANGHTANGHTANGYTANGHTANGHSASSMYGHVVQPAAPPLPDDGVEGRTLDAAIGVVGVTGGGSTSSSSVSSPMRPAQPSTSRGDQPSTSNDSANYNSKAPPIEKKLKKKAKENPYDALPASLKAKLNNPDYETLSRYRKDIPALMEDHSDESEDEIANIKAQVRREMEKERDGRR